MALSVTLPVKIYMMIKDRTCFQRIHKRKLFTTMAKFLADS